LFLFYQEKRKRRSIGVLAIFIRTEMFRTGLRVNQYYHYCGGVAPSYAQMNNYQPLSNVSFVLVNLETCEQCIVQADSTGIIRLYLPKGSYGIKEMRPLQK